MLTEREEISRVWVSNWGTPWVEVEREERPCLKVCVYADYWGSQEQDL